MARQYDKESDDGAQQGTADSPSQYSSRSGSNGLPPSWLQEPAVHVNKGDRAGGAWETTAEWLLKAHRFSLLT